MNILIPGIYMPNYAELVNELRESAANKRLMLTAADAIEELTAELEYTKRQYDLAVEDLEKIGWGEWIPVTERLPEDLKVVLAVEDENVFVAHCEHYYGEEEVYVEWHDTTYYPASPTHWMPLPTPPKEETE